jgi:malate dehydrogenase (oxaloacetate-decarboxylating)(NADP+)
VVPRIAMISFSNFGSAPHPESLKVANGGGDRPQAAPRSRRFDGEVQADIAVEPEQAARSVPVHAA